MNIRNIPDDSLTITFHTTISHAFSTSYHVSRCRDAQKIDVGYANERTMRINICNYCTISQNEKYRCCSSFRKDRFDQYSNFARIGEGSLGGKGRGLAFIGYSGKNSSRT